MDEPASCRNARTVTLGAHAVVIWIRPGRHMTARAQVHTRKLIPFYPAAQDVVLQGLSIYNVLVCFPIIQPMEKRQTELSAKRLTRGFR